MTNRFGMVALIVGIFMCLPCTSLNAGVFDTLFSHYEIGFKQTFGEDPDVPPEPKALIKTRDGGYAFAGTAMTLPAPEGSGRGAGFWLVKTDKNGKLQWQRTFATNKFSGREEAYSLVQTPDEGYLLVGSTSAGELAGVPKKGFAGMVVKFANDGHLLWHKTYGTLQQYAVNRISRIATVKDGYVLAGVTTVYIAGQPTPTGEDREHCLWLLKIDEEGNVQWEKVFKDVNAPADINYSHLLADEVGNVALAFSSSVVPGPVFPREQRLEQLGFARPAQNMLVLGFDKNGNKTSHLVLPETSMGNINLTATKEGYLASGYKYEAKYMWFAWLDKKLAPKEHKTVDTQDVSLTFLVPTSDGGFYGAGGTAKGAAVGFLGKEGRIVDMTNSGFDSKWKIKDAVAGADEHRFVTLWQAFAQKRAVLVEVIHKPGK